MLEIQEEEMPPSLPEMPEGDTSRARVYGQTLTQMPLDLYIPPDALEVLLEAFEGPLDLLLYLIRKANIDILDIPMAPLTRQYLDYVETMRNRNLELAAEYLVMAAVLIEIKSRMLLPRPKTLEGEETEDPRAELARRLLEYEQIRLSAYKLEALSQAERDFFWVDTLVEKTLVKRYPEVSLTDLQNAWRGILRQNRLRKHHQIAREELSVREHMGIILRQLQESKGYVLFESLFDPLEGIPSLVVHFMALLELIRESLIDVVQAEAFSPIHVKLTMLEASIPKESLA